MIGERLEKLTWDSHWLGLPVARYVAGPHTPGPALTAAIAHGRATGTRLLYLVLPPGNAPAAAAARAAGAWLADEKRTYQLRLPAATALRSLPPYLELTTATGCTPQLRDLARQSGEFSRFRHDARIGPLHFEQLYDQWLRQALTHGIVWTVAAGNELLGLLAFGVRGGQASIELLAVAPAARRQHLGQALVSAAVQEAQRRGHTTLQVVTQGANEPAWRFYERCGFGLRRTEHIYHLWL